MKIDKRFISNLATYLIGIGIGILLVGLILQMKQRVFQNHQAKQDAQAAEANQIPPQGQPASGE